MSYQSNLLNFNISLCIVCIGVFQLQSGFPSLGKNMPSVAGNLKWSQELRNRILNNRSNLCQLACMYGHI